MAVLGAAAGLQADDALDLDLGPAPRHPHLVGQRQKFVEPVVGQLEHSEHLVLGQALAPLEHLLAGLGQDVAHRAPLDLNAVQVRVAACNCTNATWSKRRRRSWTTTG